MKSTLYFLITSFIFSSSIFAQSSNEYWTKVQESEIPENAERWIVPDAYKTLKLDLEAFESILESAPLESAPKGSLVISIPMPDGTFQKFNLFESPIMEPELAAKFPEIHTYYGQGIDDRSATLRMDITPKGIHAMILSPNGNVFIDPYHTATNKEYITYYRKNYTQKVLGERGTCLVENLKSAKSEPNFNQSESSGDELRTYRLALATTGEYSTFHGGTVSSAMAAVVTSINRVVGIYEREVSVRLILVANNDALIYTNSGTDPYSNNNGGAMLGQNQATVNSLIGTANYDIGHVFSTGGGGVAGLGVICIQNSKARGVTGLPSPVGDPFDVDYVAHEMGHQFGGNHTFNGTSGSCSGGNRNGPTAYEPGSGTTIMAYAGICGADNIQSNSDPYFHPASYDEIITYTTVSAGNNCPVITVTGNQAPIVSAGQSGMYIPINTPFELTAVNGSDPDGDSISYSWEQFDLGSGGSPNTPVGNAPLFRSFPPVASPTRVFPRIQDIISNSSTFGEILPSNTRDLNFIVTVRDNRAGGGGVDFDQTSFQTTDQAGPFSVITPNTNLTWEVGTFEEIVWDPANTLSGPVNCLFVDIMLSSDGGFTYPDTIASNVANDGSVIIQVPNILGNQMRIKIKASNNVFFDISNTNFIIAQPSTPGFVFYLPQDNSVICIPDSFKTQIILSSLLSFTNQVTLSAINLPAGVSVNFEDPVVNPDDTTKMTIIGLGPIADGIYTFNIGGTASSGETNSIVFSLEIQSPLEVAPNQTNPVLGSTGISPLPNLTWDALAGDIMYHLQIATDPDFNTGSLIVDQDSIVGNTFTSPTLLGQFQVFFWRIQAINDCGYGPYSPPIAFQTDNCQFFESTNIPVQIPRFGAPATVTSFINVPLTSTVQDVNVSNLDISHTWISDLEVKLISPNATEVVLFNQICDDENNINAKFDDEAVPGPLPCPPIGGNTYQPEGDLSTIAGEIAGGTWNLSITDYNNFDNGTLNAWGIKICLDDTPTPPNLITNLPLTVLQWHQENITNSFLEVTDTTSSPAQITFRLISLPQNGFIEFDGVSMSIGDTFTQEDINTNRIRYQHNGTATSSDAFTFTIQNHLGGWVGVPTFNIQITQTTDIESGFAPLSLKLYPNPASSQVNIEFTSELREKIDIDLYTTHGQLINSKSLELTNGTVNDVWNTSELSSGIYLLKIRTKAGEIVKKLVIQK